jgi:hypothetical protein
MANFPTSLDSFTNPTGTDPLDSPDHATQHESANDAIKALEAKVGVNSSAVTASHDYKLSGVTGTDKAVSNTGTETLTNKTLTAPILTNKNSTGEDEGVETLTNKTLNAPAYKGLVDGWILADETWVYDSATTITVPSGATARYSVGDKIRWKQGGAYKYAYVVTVAATLLTVAGDAVTNAEITDNYYSKANSPVGFPAWFAYTPTGVAGSNVTLASRFRINGRECRVQMAINFTGGITFTTNPTIPVMASASMTTTGSAANDIQTCGTGGYRDSGTGNFPSTLKPIIVASATTVIIMSGNAVALSASSPTSWANGDAIWLDFSYEI